MQTGMMEEFSCLTPLSAFQDFWCESAVASIWLSLGTKATLVKVEYVRISVQDIEILIKIINRMRRNSLTKMSLYCFAETSTEVTC